MRKKKIIGLILLVILLVLVGVLIFWKSTSNLSRKQKNDEETTKLNYNTTESLITSKIVEGLLFSNISCSYDDQASNLHYNITNQTEETIHLHQYQIIIKDKEDKILTTIEPIVDLELLPHEEFYTGNTVNTDLSTAYSMEITLL